MKIAYAPRNICLILILGFNISCLITTKNEHDITSSNTDILNQTLTKSINTKEGWIEYDLRLELKGDDDASLLEDIILGAIEGVVEHIDPRFSVKFKNEHARIDFEKIHFLDNEFQFDDSLDHTFRLFDLKEMIVTDFENDDQEQRVAKIQSIDQEKYEVIKTSKQKDILGYDCTMAFLIHKSDQDTITVWYTDKIDIPLSPFDYIPINGLSLEMVIEGIVLRAVQISFEEMDEDLFLLPENIKVRKKKYWQGEQQEI